MNCFLCPLDSSGCSPPDLQSLVFLWANLCPRCTENFLLWKYIDCSPRKNSPYMGSLKQPSKAPLSRTSTFAVPEGFSHPSAGNFKVSTNIGAGAIPQLSKAGQSKSLKRNHVQRAKRLDEGIATTWWAIWFGIRSWSTQPISAQKKYKHNNQCVLVHISFCQFISPA